MYNKLLNSIVNTVADAKDIPVEDINEETTLSMLGLDSLDYVEIMVLIKKEFNLSLNLTQVVKSTDITLREFCMSVVSSQPKGFDSNE